MALLPFKKPKISEIEKLGWQAETNPAADKVESPELLPTKESQEQPSLGQIRGPEVTNQPISAGGLVSKRTMPVMRPAKSDELKHIESILEEDLKDIYFSLEPRLQEKFKNQGEQTAAKIETILFQTKVKAKSIFKLIFSWLKIIPGINKFFIRQAAKIKTSRILQIKK